MSKVKDATPDPDEHALNYRANAKPIDECFYYLDCYETPPDYGLMLKAWVVFYVIMAFVVASYLKHP